MSHPRLEDGARAPLCEHPNFQLGAPLSPSTSEAKVAKAVVAFFPAHRAHLTTMRNLANSSSLLSGHVCVAVLRTPRTIRTRLREIEPGYYEIEWPSTLHGTSLDGGAVIEANKIGRFLIRKFGGLRYTVSGDFQGEHALTAQIITEMAASAQVLIPEGLGVFRSITNGYPWVVRSWRSSIGLITTDTIKEGADWLACAVNKERQRRWRRRLRPMWRLFRIAILALQRPGTDGLSKSSEFHTAVSNWPQDVVRLLGIHKSEYLAPQWLTNNRTNSGTGLSRTKYDALLVHQSLRLTHAEWSRILIKLSDLNLTSVLVKPDRHKLDLGNFLSSLREALPRVRIKVYSGNLSAEELAVGASVAKVVSVTSTALFNLACATPTHPSLISLAPSYWELKNPGKGRPELEDMGYAFLPLRLTGRERHLKFL